MTLGTGAKLTDNASELILEVHLPIVVAIVLLLCLCVSFSWASCWSHSTYVSKNGCNGLSLIDGTCCVDRNGSCHPSCGGGGLICNNSVAVLTGCRDNGRYSGYADGFCCSTSAEADSLLCVLNPEAEGCTDACTEYKNDCEGAGGVFNGHVVDDRCVSSCDICNTQEALQNKDYWFKACCEGGLTPQWICQNGISTDGMFISKVQGGCNTANWETNSICEVYYSSSAAAQSSSSAAAQSSSSVSEYCQLFPTDLACICAADSTNQSCQYLNSSASPGSSGSEGVEGSSGSEGGGGSGSGGGGGAAGDWEYDYRDSLHRIINATSRTALNTQSVAQNTGIIASILQQAKCLFQDCTDYDALKDALDTNIVIPDGGTAGILDSMSAKNNLDSLAGVIDGLGNSWQNYGDSVDVALDGLGEGVDGLFSDSGLYGPMNDYKAMIEDKFPTSQWSYTSACPTALNSSISFTFPAPIGTININKSIGNYFCGPLPPFNITLGNMIRAVIRLALTIAMAIGIFKAATGFNNE